MKPAYVKLAARSLTKVPQLLVVLLRIMYLAFTLCMLAAVLFANETDLASCSFFCVMDDLLRIHYASRTSTCRYLIQANGSGPKRSRRKLRWSRGGLTKVLQLLALPHRIRVSLLPFSVACLRRSCLRLKPMCLLFMCMMSR